MKEELSEELEIIWEECPLLVFLISGITLAAIWTTIIFLDANFLYPMTFFLMVLTLKSAFKWVDKASEIRKRKLKEGSMKEELR